MQLHIAGQTAVLDGLIWKSDDAELAFALNTLQDIDGPKGHDSHPQLDYAKRVAARTGGTLTGEPDPTTPSKPGTVY